MRLALQRGRSRLPFDPPLPREGLSRLAGRLERRSVGSASGGSGAGGIGPGMLGYVATTWFQIGPIVEGLATGSGEGEKSADAPEDSPSAKVARVVGRDQIGGRTGGVDTGSAAGSSASWEATMREVGRKVLIKDLGDGLVLRHATTADTDALAAFNARIHREVDPNVTAFVAHWTKDLMSGRHPSVRACDFTIVEDTRTEQIASSLCLISQTWSYGGIEFGVGRPELVGTDPEYRRGLVREQFQVIHEWSRQRGELAQAITGIPNFYRQFGYEMTVDLDSYRRARVRRRQRSSGVIPSRIAFDPRPKATRSSWPAPIAPGYPARSPFLRPLSCGVAL